MLTDGSRSGRSAKLQLIKNTNYVIRSIDDQDRYEYWSNDFGWVSLSVADQFTPEEQKTLNLPMGGEWVPYSQIISQLDESKKNHPTYQRRTDLSVAGDE